jgi:hypothetical protein
MLYIYYKYITFKKKIGLKEIIFYNIFNYKWLEIKF